jgi:hypothetical protein
MIGLSMCDTMWPPGWPCHLWVKLPRDTSDKLSPVIRIIDLLSGLDKFDICFSDGSTVDLLQAFERFLIVSSQKPSVSERQHGFLMASDVQWHYAFMKHFPPFCPTAIISRHQFSCASFLQRLYIVLVRHVVDLFCPKRLWRQRASSSGGRRFVDGVYPSGVSQFLLWISEGLTWTGEHAVFVR